MSKSLVIGLTGSTGAGKSTVSGYLAARGFYIIDADRLSRRAVELGSAVLAALADRFGDDVLKPDGTLNRTVLAARAFADPAETAALNAIVHPEVIRLLQEELEAAKRRGEPTIVLDVPLLFQTGLETLCDCTVAVTAAPEVRCRRICRRDGLTEKQAQLRMAAQPEDEYYARRATVTLVNDTDEPALQAAVKAWLDRIGR